MNLMPSIVMEVSAMFVDTTHFRTPSGATSKTCQNKIPRKETSNSYARCTVSRNLAFCLPEEDRAQNKYGGPLVMGLKGVHFDTKKITLLLRSPSRNHNLKFSYLFIYNLFRV